MNPIKSIPQLIVAVLISTCLASYAQPDGKIFPPRNYKGSLEEKAQEAILIFHPGDTNKSATQDMILKIKVAGDVDAFGWVIPLPNTPELGKEDPKLFTELFKYVQARKAAAYRKSAKGEDGITGAAKGAQNNLDAELIKREHVGVFDISIVKENKQGGLNNWLKENNYQTIEDGDDILSFYRKQNYVFACIKVADTSLTKHKTAELHPVRFTFKTGGRDGILFPMKLTSLQNDSFDVNLYIFYDKWINDRLSRFGYTHSGFNLRWRDYDSRQCTPNAGKLWANPQKDPYLKHYAKHIPTVQKLFKKHHPDNRYYLTNIYIRNLKPADVRNKWKGDLWVFPYYTNRNFIPYDARPGGPAASAYPE